MIAMEDDGGVCEPQTEEAADGSGDRSINAGRCHVTAEYLVKAARKIQPELKESRREDIAYYLSLFQSDGYKEEETEETRELLGHEKIKPCL